MRVDTSESRPESGGGQVEPGAYHWMIEDVTADVSDFGASLKVVASVLAGTNSAMVGHKQTEFFQCSGKAVDRLRRLLVATGMMTDEQWVARIGQPLEFDEQHLKGRQFCARIKMEPYRGKKEEHQGKSFPAMGFDIFSPFEQRAADIPKDPEMLALLTPPAGATQPAKAASPSPAAKPQTTAAAATAGASSSKFGW